MASCPSFVISKMLFTAFLSYRRLNIKDRPLLWRWSKNTLSTLSLNGPFCDGQPKPDASGIAGSILVHSEESVKNPGARLFGNAGPSSATDRSITPVGRCESSFVFNDQDFHVGFHLFRLNLHESACSEY